MIEDDAKTLWCGNLSDQVTEELLYELFLQAGPLEKVRIPRDRDGRQRNFSFITFCHEVSVPYAISLFQGTALFNRTLVLQCRTQPSLPPPVRCSSDYSIDFPAQSNICDQFSEMMGNLSRHESYPPMNGEQHNLTNASYRDKLNNRQHPYRQKNHNRGQGGHPRGNDDHNKGRSKHNEQWDRNPWQGQRKNRDQGERNYGRHNKRKR